MPGTCPHEDRKTNQWLKAERIILATNLSRFWNWPNAARILELGTTNLGGSWGISGALPRGYPRQLRTIKKCNCQITPDYCRLLQVSKDYVEPL